MAAIHACATLAIATDPFALPPTTVANTVFRRS